MLRFLYTSRLSFWELVTLAALLAALGNLWLALEQQGWVKPRGHAGVSRPDGRRWVRQR